MNTYLSDAGNDLFEKCTQAQKQAAFSFMVSSVAKYKIKPSFFGGTELPKRITTSDLLKWFSACSNNDQVKVVMLVVSSWVDEFKNDHEACKMDPGHLDRVTVGTLQNIAMQEQELAHQQIIQAFPDSVEMLLDFETLAAFGTSSDRPSQETVDAVKSSLSRVWARAGQWHHQQAAVEAGKAAPVSRVTEAKKAANAEVVEIIKKAVRISKGSEAQNG